jgi:DNA invertase Pin-like site-specific DNA recombinase
LRIRHGQTVFQEMLAEARSKPRPFDTVLVHSFSRFCRDEFTYAAAKRDLTRNFSGSAS